MQWHFLATDAADGAWNMAFDEALMARSRRTGDAAFRVYSWNAPTLSLGRNQRARSCYDLAAATRLGVAFVRRPTGGRALLHHHEVTYSVTMPCADPATAGSAYHFINEVLLGGLSALGVRASRASTAAAAGSLPPGIRPCFDVPSAHEITVGDKKLVGSAQWRHDGALLQHGSILVRDDQAIIARLMRSPEGVATPSAATLLDALGREPTHAEVAECLLSALRQTTRERVRRLGDDERLNADAARLRDTYADDDWTWRR
jgi:lipoate-protein ligase A